MASDMLIHEPQQQDGQTFATAGNEIVLETAQSQDFKQAQPPQSVQKSSTFYSPRLGQTGMSIVSQSLAASPTIV